MYLDIASYLYGKQIKSKLGTKLYLWMIFIVYTWIGLVSMSAVPWFLKLDLCDKNNLQIN